MLFYICKTKTQPELLTGGVFLLDGIGRDTKKIEENQKVARQGSVRSPQPAPTPSAMASMIANSTVTKPNARKHVRFNSVELQEYALTVGDHPLCKGHFPLTLDWCHAQPVAFRINDYEALKMRRRAYEPWALQLSARERWERLRLVTGMNETSLAHLELARNRPH